jgi:adenylyltransferase/sulfurtransferase
MDPSKLSSLSPSEKNRYSRHLLLSDVGLEGQMLLKQAKVLVIGAGGLGCPVLQLLSTSGVGTIGVVDGDLVSESNLQRQFLFAPEDIGKNKSEVASKKLSIQNPTVLWQVFPQMLQVENALTLIKDFDLVIDGSDNFSTRYLVNDACVILGKPFVSGSLFKTEAQVSVFNDVASGTYRCLFPEEPTPEEMPSCSEIGVFSVLPSFAGAMMASEALKWILKKSNRLNGKLWTHDLMTGQTSIFRYGLIPENKTIKQLIPDYDVFCGVKKAISSLEITFERLKSLNDFLLIDIREPIERETTGPIVIAEGQEIFNGSDLSKAVFTNTTDKPLVLYCQKGQRSLKAVKLLTERVPQKKIFSLSGGFEGWKNLNL